MLYGAPCHCIVEILHSFVSAHLTLYFYTEPHHQVWTYTTHLMWSGEYLTTISIIPFLWGPWLIHYFLFLIAFGPSLCSTRGIFVLFILTLPCCVSMLLWCLLLLLLLFLLIWFCSSLWLGLMFVSWFMYMCVLCIDCTKCHGLLDWWSRIWLVSLFYFWQFAPLGIIQSSWACAWYAKCSTWLFCQSFSSTFSGIAFNDCNCFPVWTLHVSTDPHLPSGQLL